MRHLGAWSWLVVLFLALGSACSEDDGAPSSDAGTADAGKQDSGAPDANPVDANVPDSGGDATVPDAGHPDAMGLDATDQDAAAADGDEPDADLPDQGASDAEPGDADPGDVENPDSGSPDSGLRWDLTEDFIEVTNPSGVWTYAWSTSLGGALVVYPRWTDSAAFKAWDDPGNSVLGTPSVWKNAGSGPSNGVPAGMVSLHPGQAGEYSVVRFTAPRAGTYSASVHFDVGDIGETDGTVRVNGGNVFAIVATSTSPSFTLSPRALDAGDTVEIWVGPVGSGTYDNTPAGFTIDAH